MRGCFWGERLQIAESIAENEQHGPRDKTAAVQDFHFLLEDVKPRRSENTSP
jgi:hypothetical protein